MRKLWLVMIFVCLLSACNIESGSTQATVSSNPNPTVISENPTDAPVAPTSDNQPLPTHTPSVNETVATPVVPITSSDDCTPAASASGIVIDAEQERAEAPRTLPNGRAFPGTAPINTGFTSAGANRANDKTQVMIQFTPDSSSNERNEYIRQIGGTTRREIEVLNTYMVDLRPNVSISELPSSPIVLHAEIDEIAGATQSEPTPPNDPRYAEQWALPVVGLPEAWAGLPSRTVVVAVVDSGVCANHPDLQGRIRAGYDFVDNDNDPADVFGHGCGVAGVIAANANNGMGIAGVAPNVQIMPLRVLDANGLGNYSNIAAAIAYAVDNGANIINLSLAGSSSSSIIEAAVNYATQRGVIVIAAAGNFAQPRAYYPAAYTNVIAVGSIDPNLQPSSFSNYGADIDVWAPGRDILTTSMNGDYQFMSGTSFAAPVVAGVMAITQAFDTTLNTENGIVFIYPPDATPNCP
jgi:subtilisin family serine protease